MSKISSSRKFRHYLLTGLGLMALTSAIQELSLRTRLVKRLETANLDALFSGKERKVSPDVVVVSITDDDYQTVFGGVSPLNAEKLQGVIDDILEGHPRALGVDFDTSAWDARAAKNKYDGQPVVWAREALGEAGSLTMGKALGGSEDICCGVPAYFPDEDGIVREYKEFIKGSDGKYYPSLAFNLVKVAVRGREGCQGASPTLERNQSDKPARVNFRGPKNVFDHLSIGTLSKLKNLPAGAAPPLLGKIVLLGGAYRAARDTYPTPMRYMDGVDIIANSVDANLPGNKGLADSPVWLYVWGYVEGVALLVGLYFVSRTWSLIILVVTGPAYALVVNWLAFQWAGAFVSFVPCFVGIVIQQIVEHAFEYHRLRQENRELHEQLKRLPATPAGLSTPSQPGG